MLRPDQLIYVELKTDRGDRGPAWITRARLSKSGRTVYAVGRALQRVAGGAGSGNHVCAETGEAFWVSGVKRDGSDRHHAGGGIVRVDARVLDEYLAFRGLRALDPLRHVVDDSLGDTDAARFHEDANRPLE